MATTYTRQHDFTTDRDATPPIPIKADRVDAELDAVKTSIDTIVTAGGVTTIILADLVVTTAKIADNAVTTAKIADNAITSAKITDSNITTAKIADVNITTGKLADSSVTTVKVADANITTAKITDANITTAKLATNSVTTVKITDANVTTAKITDANITTAKIADANVTTAKLADNSVTTVKVTDANITTAKIADANITADKIASDAVTTVKVLDANITTAKITDANVTTAKIADSAVTNAKLPSNLAMDATKIADGSISNAEFQYLNGATSNIQGQFDSMVDPSFQVDETDTNTAKNKSVSNVLAKGWQETKTAFDAQDISVHTDPLTMDEESTPSNPASNKHKLYFKSDGMLYRLNSTGSESQIGGDADSVVTNAADIFTTNVRLLEQHGTASAIMEKGFTDELGTANDMIDESASSGYTYDATNDNYVNTVGASGSNDDKPYTDETNYIQQEWTTAIVGSSNGTFTNGSATVTISSGTWPANCATGRISQDGTNWYDISTRDSATQLTIGSTFAQSTITGTFTIRMSEFAAGVVKLNSAGVTAVDQSQLTQNTSGSDWGRVTGNNKRGGSFIAGATGNLISMVVGMHKTGSPTDNVSIELYASTGSAPNALPTGGVLATSGVIDGSTLGSGLSALTFTFASPYSVTSGTGYAWAATRSGSVNGSNHYNNFGHNSAPYANGNGVYHNGSGWAAISEDPYFSTTVSSGGNLITEYVSVADSYAQSTDVSAWSDINSTAITETLNSQNAYYWVIFNAVSAYGANTEVSIFNQTGSVWRTIAKNSGGTWQYNNNASHNSTETLVNSTVNNMLHACSQAVSTQAANRMTATEAAAISDAEWTATNGFTTAHTLLTRGLTLVSSSATQNPEVSLFRVNYDADASAMSLISKQWNGSAGRPSAPATAPETMYLFVVDEQTSGTPSYFVSRDGTNFTAVTFDASWVFSGNKMARRASISMSATNTGTNPKFKVTCPQGAVYKIHAVGLQTRG